MATQVRTFSGLRGSALSIAIACVAGTDLALFGYDQGVTGGLLNLPSFTKQFPEICATTECLDGKSEHEKYHRSLIQGVTVASYSLGCAVGALLAVHYGNITGRRWAIFVGSLIMIVGAILQCAAYSLAMFTVGRVICGVGNGINTSTVPVWQSECSKPHHRGRTVAFDLSLVIIGVAIAYWVDFGMSYTEPSAVAWRFPIAFQCVFALVVVGWILFLPESPRWLVLRGRDDEGLQVLSAIYNVPMDHPIAQENLQAIKSTVLLNDSTGYRDIFTSGPERHFHRTILGCIAQMMQQLTGINVIAYYQTSIYQNQLNLGPLTSRLLAGCTSTVFWLSTIPPIFVIDRVGRRKLVLFSSGGMLVCLCFMAGMMSHTTRGTGIVAAVMIFLYNFFYSSGWNLFGWLYPSEILPITIRAQGNALAVTSNWLFAFMVVMVTPVMFNSLGWKTYIVYAAFNAVMLPVIHFFYPETSCRSLEEMDVIFAKSRNAFDTVQVAKSQPRHYDRKGELLHSVAADLETTLTEIRPEAKPASATHLETSVGDEQ